MSGSLGAKFHPRPAASRFPGAVRRIRPISLSGCGHRQQNRTKLRGLGPREICLWDLSLLMCSPDGTRLVQRVKPPHQAKPSCGCGNGFPGIQASVHKLCLCVCSERKP